MRYNRIISILALNLMMSGIVGCTGQIAGAFRYLPVTEDKSPISVNTKIDLLWVVDNSSSIDVHQEKLRNAFAGFANTYLQPTWDIRLAVITTDTYLANNAYTSYLQKTIPGTIGYKSTYLSNLSWLNSFVNPSWDTTLVDIMTGAFPHGLTLNDLNPHWGPNYAKLLPGIHDGPITAFCMEAMPYFLKGVTQCGIRDNMANLSTYNGPSKCLNPNTSAGESSLSQCINTIENDTVRSGTPIISTVPPSGTPADSAWVSKVINNSMINFSVGSSGSGSERGLSSVLQFLNDNEVPTGNPFFRSGSLRGIIFLSDEDDQSLALPAPLPSGLTPFSDYGCDQASLLANNGNSPMVNRSGGLCCSDGTCTYGSAGISCAPKTVDNYTYTLGICVNQADLIPVATVKQQLDQFFTNLDGGNNSLGPNYFTVAITPTSGTSIQSIMNARASVEAAAGTVRILEANRGDRYIALGNLVGGGSLALDISATDYSPVLQAIGQEIVQKKSIFTLARAPTSQEEMSVVIVHADGTSYTLLNTQYTVSGTTLTITDSALVLSLSLTDVIDINYQPKTAY